MPPSDSSFRIRFGVWAPYRGAWVVDDVDHGAPARFAQARDVVLSAERAGFDTVLIAQHTINPVDTDHEVLEAWTSAAAVAALTRRIEVIAAIKPYLYHPAVLAKMALGIQDISEGRFAINFVNAWFKPELERSGIGFAEHDTRYAYGREWLQVFRALVSGESVTHQGEHFKLDGFRLSPVPAGQRPIIYAGGESEAGIGVVNALADRWLINGRPLDDVLPLLQTMQAQQRSGAPLSSGITGFVVARETDDEAHAELERLLARQLPYFSARRDQMRTRIDDKAVALQVSRRYPTHVPIGANGGTAPGFVGSYDTVARRLLAFYDAGLSTFLLSFFPLIEEQERFAAHVIPRVRALINASTSAERAAVLS